MYSHLSELLQDRAARYPDAIALGGAKGLGWETLTSQQMLAQVDTLAAELAREGIGTGDRVVLWTPNALRTPVYLFALWRLGAVPVPFDRDTNDEAADRIIDQTAPRAIITGYGERRAWARGRATTEWWEPGSRDAPAPEPSPAPHAGSRPAEDLALISFTSGTTGDPKGCMITHANLCSQVEALTYPMRLDSDCRLAGILPLSHLFELVCGLLYPLSQGAAIHYVPSRRAPDILRVLTEQRITHMNTVPQVLILMGAALDRQLHATLRGPLYAAMMALADRLPPAGRRRLFWPLHRRLGGHLRFIASGGAALDPEIHRLWERIGVQVVQGYGTSECSPVVACGSDDGRTPVGSVGKPLRGVAVRLSAEGELLVRGPNVMRGYWNDPKRTAEAIVDGWYHTGDLASIDADGNIRLAGRARDLIVLPSGMNVWPEDVENALRADPAVKDAAVVTSPTPSGGAALHAYLLPETERDRGANLAALVARCNGRLAPHQRVATASWWPEADFPRTTTLKVRRMLLPPPDQARMITVAATEGGGDPTAVAITAVARVPAVRDEQTLAEVGLDSLSIAELAVELEERTGRYVADGDLQGDMTVAQVRSIVQAAPAADEGEERAAARPGSQADTPLWPYTRGRWLRWLGFPFDIIFRIGVTRTIILGREHLRGVRPPVIIAGTHHGFPDLPLVRRSLGRGPGRQLGRNLIVAAAGGGAGFRSFFSGYAVLAFGIYPLEREYRRSASLRRLASLIAGGCPTLYFPQGTHARPAREREGDTAVRFRPGVALLAEATDAAVLPFGLAGTEDLMPAFLEEFHGKVIAGIPVTLRRGPLVIAYGPPLRVEADETAEDFAARLQEVSYALTRRAERVYAAARGREGRYGR